MPSHLTYTLYNGTRSVLSSLSEDLKKVAHTPFNSTARTQERHPAMLDSVRVSAAGSSVSLKEICSDHSRRTNNHGSAMDSK